MSTKINQKSTPFARPALLTFGIEKYDRLKKLGKDMKLIMPASGDLSHELLLLKVLESYRKPQLTAVHARFWQQARNINDYPNVKTLSVSQLRRDIVTLVMEFLSSMDKTNGDVKEPRTYVDQNTW